MAVAQRPDVRQFYEQKYPRQMSRFSKEGITELDVARLQKENLNRILNALNEQVTALTLQISQMQGSFECRTAVFSPPKGTTWSAATYRERGQSPI